MNITRMLGMPLLSTLMGMLLWRGAGSVPAEQGAKKKWDFESEQPGKIARGFISEVGIWEVAIDGDNKVLAQKAKNDDDTFNIVLIEGTHYKNLDLSVRVKAGAGTLDQGGGVVWRATDKAALLHRSLQSSRKQLPCIQGRKRQTNAV